MPRNVALIFAALLSLSLTAVSGAVPTNTVTILPENCTIRAGDELPLSLHGPVPPDSVVTWNVNSGGITSVLPGTNAIFVAPSEAAQVTISVSIASAVPGGEIHVTQRCTVTSPNNAPRGLAQATGGIAASLTDLTLPIN